MDQQRVTDKQVVIIGARPASCSRPIFQALMTTFTNAWSYHYRTLFNVLCLLVTLALAGFLTLSQMTSTQMLREDKVRLERYLDGTAHKPFASRVLVPLSIRLMVQALPESVLSSVERWPRPSTGQVVPQRPPAPGWPVHYYLLAGLLGISLLAYAATSYLLYRELFASRWWYQALTPVLALVALIPFVSSKIGHVYDFTLLMFMGALLYAMVTHRHRLFLVLFAASCLNKETTVLMAVAYASYFYDRLPRREFLVYVGIQWATFALVYGYLSYHFEANPGMALEHWGLWWDHRVPYTRWLGHIAWFTGRSFQDLATLLIILTLIAFRWHKKPLVLRRAAAMLIPHLGLFLVAAAPGEVRDFYESVPLLTLFVCRNLELLGWRCLGKPADSLRGGKRPLQVFPKSSSSNSEDQRRRIQS
jgi:hypothetical protein